MAGREDFKSNIESESYSASLVYRQKHGSQDSLGDSHKEKYYSVAQIYWLSIHYITQLQRDPHYLSAFWQSCERFYEIYIHSVIGYIWN